MNRLLHINREHERDQIKAHVKKQAKMKKRSIVGVKIKNVNTK